MWATTALNRPNLLETMQSRIAAAEEPPVLSIGKVTKQLITSLDHLHSNPQSFSSAIIQSLHDLTEATARETDKTQARLQKSTLADDLVLAFLGLENAIRDVSSHDFEFKCVLFQQVLRAVLSIVRGVVKLREKTSTPPRVLGHESTSDRDPNSGEPDAFNKREFPWHVQVKVISFTAKVGRLLSRLLLGAEVGSNDKNNSNNAEGDVEETRALENQLPSENKMKLSETFRVIFSIQSIQQEIVYSLCLDTATQKWLLPNTQDLCEQMAEDWVHLSSLWVLEQEARSKSSSVVPSDTTFTKNINDNDNNSSSSIIACGGDNNNSGGSTNGSSSSSNYSNNTTNTGDIAHATSAAIGQQGSKLANAMPVLKKNKNTRRAFRFSPISFQSNQLQLDSIDLSSDSGLKVEEKPKDDVIVEEDVAKERVRPRLTSRPHHIPPRLTFFFYSFHF